MCAPASTPQPIAASVPASRSRGSRPVSAPTKSLRETASSSGRPSACSSLEAAQDGDRLRRRLGEVRAGIEHDLLGANPACARERHALGEEARDVGEDVVVEVRVLQPLLGRGARVHEHERRTALSADVRQLGVAQPADVVDDGRAGVDGRLRDRRLVRVDRDDRPEL